MLISHDACNRLDKSHRMAVVSDLNSIIQRTTNNERTHRKKKRITNNKFSSHWGFQG